MSKVLDCLGMEVDMGATILGANFVCVWRFKRYKGHVIERHHYGGYEYSICGKPREWYRTMAEVKGVITASMATR